VPEVACRLHHDSIQLLFNALCSDGSVVR
jgi:hypothetical protein